MKQLSIYFFLLLGGVQFLPAQSVKTKKTTSYFSVGEKEYAGQRYVYAISFLKPALGQNVKNDSLAKLHIADSYWHIKQYDSALRYYEQFEEKYGRIFSSGQRLAELFATFGRYDRATAIYRQLIKEIPSRVDRTIRARLSGFAAPALFLRDSLSYTVQLLNLNTGEQDFSPQYFQHGIVFVSNRYSKKTAEKEFGWDGLPFASIYRVQDTLDLYVADSVTARALHHTRLAIKLNDDYTARTSNDNDVILVNSTHSGFNATIQQLEKFSNDLNTKYNYGPLCFNKKGDTVYFTRNNMEPSKGKYNLEICMASLEKGRWGNIKVMPFVQQEYNYYHPALSTDETRLYFCSNMPGGFGGSDIYYVSLLSDYGKMVPILLDQQVNTSGNELFPTYKNNTLYFSSDGHPGLGGLDIYSTRLQRGNWTKPRNLGYPINSAYDDFGIVWNTGETQGLFSSNRFGSDDIYKVDQKTFRVYLEGNVLNKKDMRRLGSVKVQIRSNEAEDSFADSVTTDLSGNYRFLVKPGRAYLVSFERSGFYSDSLKITNSGVVFTNTQLPTLLAPVETVATAEQPVTTSLPDRDQDGVPDAKDKCPDIKGTVANEGCPDIQARLNELAKMVFFKTASDQLTQAALKPLNEVVTYLQAYPNLMLHIEGHTDNRAGAVYNKNLSQRRASSVKNFFVKKGFETDRFTAKGFGLEKPIASNDTEEGRAMNRRVTIQANFR